MLFLDTPANLHLSFPKLQTSKGYNGWDKPEKAEKAFYDDYDLLK